MFDFSAEIASMWRSCLEESMRQQGVSFGHENDDRAGDSGLPETMSSLGDGWLLHAEAWTDGGDWEHTVAYFRCQLYRTGASPSVPDRKFIYVPRGDEGNALHLVDDRWYSYGNERLDPDDDRTPGVGDAPAFNWTRMWAALKLATKKVLEAQKRYKNKPADKAPPFRAYGDLLGLGRG